MIYSNSCFCVVHTYTVVNTILGFLWPINPIIKRYNIFSYNSSKQNNNNNNNNNNNSSGSGSSI